MNVVGNKATVLVERNWRISTASATSMTSFDVGAEDAEDVRNVNLFAFLGAARQFPAELPLPTRYMLRKKSWMKVTSRLNKSLASNQHNELEKRSPDSNNFPDSNYNYLSIKNNQILRE